MKKRLNAGACFDRAVTLERDSASDEDRTVVAALSSESPVERFFGIETLVHEKKSINMERAINGLPLLYGHDSNSLIGRVEDIKLGEDRKLRGTLRFSKNQRAEEAWNDVKDGFLRDISIGYRIDKWEETEDDPDDVRVTRWTPLEASVVAVPADHTVGVNRQLNRSSIMAVEEDTGSTGAAEDTVNVAQFTTTRKKLLSDGEREGAKRERERAAKIRNMFSIHLFRGAEIEDLMNACVDSGISVDRAKDTLLDYLGNQVEPIGADFRQSEEHGSLDQRTVELVERQRSPWPVAQHQSVAQPSLRAGIQPKPQAGKDAVEKFKEGTELALLVRAGLIRDKEQINQSMKCEFRGLTLAELASEYLRISNAPSSGLDRMARVGLAFTRQSVIGHGTSDFASLLENVASKSLLIGYNEAPETWQMWARTGSLPDFRPASRVQLSGFTDLDVVVEQGEFTHGTVADSKETMILATYGKLFAISRQAVINDDLDGLSRIPSSMGRAAARKVGDLAYAVLTTTHLMADGTTLFDAAAHANYNASGTAPSVASIEAVRGAMRRQTDSKGNIVGLAPSFLLAATGLEGTVRVLQAGQYDPAGTAGTLIPNTVQGTFTVISDARLDFAVGVHSVTDWYMAASPSMGDTVEVAFLDGNSTPFMEQRTGWTTDGTEFKVRIDAVAKALDWRFLYKQNGA